MRFAPLRTALAAALALTSCAVAANVGRVDFAVGTVTAQQPSASPRALAKGSELLSGDRIVTADGRAQLRFADGAYVSLLPNTEFVIRDYRYDGRTDGSEKSFLGLLRGSIRAVTGLIGRVNKSAYQIQTPTATLGIRGTGGIVEVMADGSTRVTGTSGIWTMTNAAGTLEVPAGTAALTTRDTARAPQRTAGGFAPPPAPRAAGANTQRAAANNDEDDQHARSRDSDGDRPDGRGPRGGQAPGAAPGSNTPAPQFNVTVPTGTTTSGSSAANPPAAPPPDLVFIVAGANSTTPTPPGFTGAVNPAVAVDANYPANAAGGDGGMRFTGRQVIGAVLTGGTYDVGTVDSQIRWGRWNGTQLMYDGAPSLYQDIAFISGLAAQNLPTSGPKAKFDLAGATQPFIAGAPMYAGNAVRSARLDVDFGANNFQMQWQMQAGRSSTTSYLVDGLVQGPLGGSKAGQPVARWFFDGYGTLSTARFCYDASCTTLGTPSNVAAGVNGMLAGTAPGGSAAAVLYRVDLPGGAGSAAGAIGMRRVP